MSADFNDMLNDHLHYDLLKPEIQKRNYLWKNLEHDEEATGDIIVPFQKSRATSVKLGAGPSAATDISKHKYTRGSLAQADRPLVWGSLIFNHMDIMRHDGKVKQKSFLGTFLPKQIEDFTDYFSTSVNHGFLNSENLDETVGTGTSGGVLEVKRIERFEMDQKINISATDYYVIALNVNTNEITVSTTRGGSAADVSAITTGTAIYQDGFQSGNRFSNLKSLLLSNANGGSANIYGQSKLASAFTQALNKDGSSFTASNILEEIFKALVIYKKKAKVGAMEIWLGSNNMGAIMSILEQDKGPYKAVPGSTKSSEYGFTEIKIFGPGMGEVKFVLLPELDEDAIFVVDPKSMKIHSNKGINKVKSPDGLLYHTSRSDTAGIDYICDLLFEGDIIISAPYRNMVIHDVAITFA